MSRLRARLVGLLASVAVIGVLVPAMSGTSTAATPAGPAFGAQFHGMWSSYTDTQRALYLDQMKAGGATWVRIDVSWAMLQPHGRDSYDLKWGVPFVDRVVDMAHDRGLKVLVTLWLTPAWANGGAGERVLPTDVADYANAAKWAAARWSGKVQAWEVWNEPNHHSYMAGANPVDYTRLLKAAYPAIKAGNTAATVVFGGPASNDSPWIAKAYEAGAKGSFDVMATHPYMAIADLPPETPDDGTKYNFTHLAGVHALMQKWGDGHKKIWATEFGWSSHPNDGTEDNWERGVTLEQQADYLVRAIELARDTMPYVTQMFWYTDRDRDATHVHNRHYGLFYNDLTPKPAYHAMKAYLTGSTSGTTEPTDSTGTTEPTEPTEPTGPTEPTTAADLAVTASGPTTATAGGRSSYSARAVNTGTATARGYTLSGTVASGQMIMKMNAVSGGACVMSKSSWSCAFSGDLAAGATGPVVKIEVKQPRSSGTYAVPSAVATTAGELSTANNTATVKTVI